MAHKATCGQCGLTCPVAHHLGHALLTCPRCGGDVVHFDQYGPTFQMPFGSIAASLVVLVIVGPFGCGLLLWAVETLRSSPTFAGLMSGMVVGAILWRVARNRIRQLLSPRWALLANSTLAVLLAASLLLIAIATQLVPW
ncbi:MAG TPA: hypothetical protein VEL76_01015 [Gemmataceae bacterium]|nr:hypothetical protein [Gemmataceae bacterium]